MKKKQPSRQYRLQQKHLAMGMCRQCSTPRGKGDDIYCPRCRGKVRKRENKTQYTKLDHNWDSVDWSLSGPEIAKKLNVTSRAVIYQRRKRGLPIGGRGRPRKQ